MCNTISLALPIALVQWSTAAGDVRFTGAQKQVGGGFHVRAALRDSALTTYSPVIEC